MFLQVDVLSRYTTEDVCWLRLVSDPKSLDGQKFRALLELISGRVDSCVGGGDKDVHACACLLVFVVGIIIWRRYLFSLGASDR